MNKKLSRPSQKPGGPATLKGVLYQVLATLGEASQAVVSIRRGGKEAILRIEPPGGDVWIDESARRSVQQWKYRSKHSFSEAEIVQKVLPDLYLAAKEFSREERARTRFMFCTNARVDVGRLAEFCASQPLSVTAISAMSPTKAVLASSHARGKGTLRITDIVRAILKNKRFKSDAPKSAAVVIRDVLSNFEIRPEQSEQLLDSKVNEFLRPYAGEATPEKRAQLIVTLLELGGKGDQSVSAVNLFQSVGIRLTSFLPKDWKAFYDRMSKSLDTAFHNFGYQHENDVRRSAPESSVDEAASEGRSLASMNDIGLRFVVGESGTGKSWRLASKAFEDRRRGIPCVWIDARGSVDEMFGRVCDVVWGTGLTSWIPHFRCNRLPRKW